VSIIWSMGSVVVMLPSLPVGPCSVALLIP
jgi:hypothetical protein